LANALMATVGGTRPQTNPEQVCQHLNHFFQVSSQQVLVRRYGAEDFLAVFSDTGITDRVLHAEPLRDTRLRLVFQ
jgi:hypothetical protein